MNELEAARVKKAPKCQICGEPEHVAEFACPEIDYLEWEDTETGFITRAFLRRVARRPDDV